MRRGTPARPATTKHRELDACRPRGMGPRARGPPPPAAGIGALRTPDGGAAVPARLLWQTKGPDQTLARCQRQRNKGDDISSLSKHRFHSLPERDTLQFLASSVPNSTGCPDLCLTFSSVLELFQNRRHRFGKELVHVCRIEIFRLMGGLAFHYVYLFLPTPPSDDINVTCRVLESDGQSKSHVLPAVSSQEHCGDNFKTEPSQFRNVRMYIQRFNVNGQSVVIELSRGFSEQVAGNCHTKKTFHPRKCLQGRFAIRLP